MTKKKTTTKAQEPVAITGRVQEPGTFVVPSTPPPEGTAISPDGKAYIPAGEVSVADACYSKALGWPTCGWALTTVNIGPLYDVEQSIKGQDADSEALRDSIVKSGAMTAMGLDQIFLTLTPEEAQIDALIPNFAENLEKLKTFWHFDNCFCPKGLKLPKPTEAAIIRIKENWLKTRILLTMGPSQEEK